MGDTLKATLKAVATVLFAFGVSLFFNTLVLVYIIIRGILSRGQYFQAKTRSSPPTCLTDPSLGKHNYVKLKEVKLHYVESGDRSRPLVLFVHGFPEFWYSWRYQLREFSKNYWVVAVDLRGYGDSDKPSGVQNYSKHAIVGDLVQLVEALGRKSCTLVAHDWGGILAWSLASENPKLVDRLVVINAPNSLAFQDLLKSSIRQLIKSWYIFFVQFPFLPEFYFRCNDVSLIDKVFTGKICQHDIEAYKYTFSQPGDFTAPLHYYRRNFIGILKNYFTDEAATFAKLQMPVIIIWGQKDHALSSCLADMSAKYCLDCKVYPLKDGSHWVPMEQPEKVNAIIRAFLEGKEA